MAKRIESLLRKWLNWLLNIWTYVGWDDYIAFFILLVGVLGYWNNGPIAYVPGWYEVYMDIKSELIGISLSVLIIANAGELISKRQEKERLILQMGSSDNGFAGEAVRQLRARGWLTDGSLKEVKLGFSNLEGALLHGANLEGASLMGATLIDAALNGANLKGVDLTSSILNGAFLLDAELEGAYFAEAKLHGAFLDGAKLERSEWRGAELYGAKLRKAENLEEAFFQGAKYNSETVWPNDFDPKKAGAIPDPSGADLISYV